MCTEQPMYCYPNGCLNRTDSKRKKLVQSHNTDAMKTMFIVGEGNGLTHAYHNQPDKSRMQKQKSIAGEFNRNPLKDIYKTLFKYKKLPSVELRYNLREQVKNIKSDKIKFESPSASKKRWLESRHNILLGSKYNDGRLMEKPNIVPEKFKFFISSQEEDRPTSASKYFKRDLRRNEYFDKTGINNIEDKLDIIAKGFSIETLIENIISNRFDEENVSNIEFKVEYNNINNKANDSVISHEQQKHITDYRFDEPFVNIKNMSDEIEKIHVNDKKIPEVIKNLSNYTFNQLIAALSKQIELQNKTGMDMWISKTASNGSDASKIQKPNECNITDSQTYNTTDDNTN
ncbi:hypothetical protein ACJJTC_018911 [Scirpophaga incertulas]